MRSTLIAAALAVGAAGAAQAEDGAALFKSHCAVCHRPASSPAAPSLSGVFGRKIGSRADFAYSPALKAKGAAGGRWAAANLDAFLANPNAFAPGTKMYAGPLAPADRAAIIAWLKSPGP